MRILLDTNIAIWSVCDTQKISNKIFKYISDENNEVYVSLASVWEIAIKSMLKPDKIPIREKEFIDYCNQLNFVFLSIIPNHIMNLRYLKSKSKDFTHKDPFDNIIVAQSVVEDLKLFTSDRTLLNYNYNNIVIA